MLSLASGGIIGVFYGHKWRLLSNLKPAEQLNKTAETEEEKVVVLPTEYKPDLRSRKITFPFNLQSYLFLGGVLLFIVYGCIKMF